MPEPLVVPSRFRGPSSSGNGGWTAGALAELAGWSTGVTVTVTLRKPPPLETPMTMTGGTVGEEGALTAALDGEPVAVAVRDGEQPAALAEVGYDDAVAASAAYPGLRSHPFPTCFSCGTEREDGLRIFPGVVGEGSRTRVAAPWTPDSSLASTGDVDHAGLAVTWAALDCVGGWAGDIGERLMVLGRITAYVDELPKVGRPHVVVGELVGAEGRKVWTASSVRAAEGRVVGRAAHTWIRVDTAQFG